MSSYYKVTDKKSANKALRVIKQAHNSGKVFFKATGKRLAQLSRYFNMDEINGAKGVFLPSKFAGRELQWAGDMPIFTGGGAEMRFYPAPQLPYWDESEYGEVSDPSNAEAYLGDIEIIIRAYVSALPEGYIFSIVFGGTDILNGAPNSDDKQALIDEIMELITRVISSKPEVLDFWEGVLAIKPIPNKKRRKR